MRKRKHGVPRFQHIHCPMCGWAFFFASLMDEFPGQAAIDLDCSNCGMRLRTPQITGRGQA